MSSPLFLFILGMYRSRSKLKSNSEETLRDLQSLSAHAQSNQQAFISALQKLADKQVARHYASSSHINLLTHHVGFFFVLVHYNRIPFRGLFHVVDLPQFLSTKLNLHDHLYQRIHLELKKILLISTCEKFNVFFLAYHQYSLGLICSYFLDQLINN